MSPRKEPFGCCVIALRTHSSDRISKRFQYVERRGLKRLRPQRPTPLGVLAEDANRNDVVCEVTKAILFENGPIGVDFF
jgi:hypothetical protein